jgi:hypothetical protein
MVKSNLLAEFAVSKDRLIQALACVSNLADRAVVQAIVHPKDTILGFAFSNTLINGESGDQIYAYYITEEDEPDVIKSEAFIMGDHNSAVGSILQHPSSQDDDTTLDADETQSVLYG